MNQHLLSIVFPINPLEILCKTSSKWYFFFRGNSGSKTLICYGLCLPLLLFFLFFYIYFFNLKYLDRLFVDTHTSTTPRNIFGFCINFLIIVLEKIILGCDCVK
jgi:hypothetical protein